MNAFAAVLWAFVACIYIYLFAQSPDNIFFLIMVLLAFLNVALNTFLSLK